MTTVGVPITVESDATARVADLGMESQLQQMLEHTQQAVAGLRSIQVKLAYDPEEPDDDPRIVIRAYRRDPDSDYDPTDWDWGVWFVNTFPPDVCRHFGMDSWYEAPHAR